jgi:hypothetical protein
MTMAGGAADKLPNRYEHWWTALQFGELLRGHASGIIRLEPPGAAGEGIEFEMRLPGRTYVDQVKDSSERWTLHRLADVLRKVHTHLAAGKTVRLVLSMDASELSGLCKRARAAITFAEFEKIRTAEQGPEFETVAGYWPDVDQETVWRYLKLIEVRNQPGESLRNEVTLSYGFLVQDDPEAVVSILRGFFDDHLHNVVTAPQVWAYLKEITDRRSSDTGSELRRLIDYMSVTASWGRCCRSYVWSQCRSRFGGSSCCCPAALLLVLTRCDL